MRLALPYRALILAAVGLTIAACAAPVPPSGRWEGVYEDPALIVVVRLEIAPHGEVRISAPNAISDQKPLSPGDRAQWVARLESELARSWPSVGPLPLDFDGRAFRKPGGIAPQLEWDEGAHRMTMIYYSGNRASVRVPLSQVEQFGQS